MAALPAVGAQTPAPNAVNVVRNTIIDFSVEGADDVALASIEVTVKIGVSNPVPAVIAGILQFPFDGPGGSVGDTGPLGYRIQLDYRGKYLPTAVIEVTVDADNLVAESMPTDSYSFTTDNEQLVGIQLVQIAQG